MHTLTGQLIAIMLFALALSYAITLFISHSERERVVFQVRREDCLTRTASIASMLGHTPIEQRSDIMRSINSPWNRFWVSSTPANSPLEWQAMAREHLLAVRVRNAPTPAQSDRSTQAEVIERALFEPRDLPDVHRDWEPIQAAQRGEVYSGQFLTLDAWNGMGAVLRIGDNLYLNAVTAKPRDMAVNNSTLYVSFAISALTLSLASVLVAKRVGRPLRRLADMAERIGRGEDSGELPSEGAEDIQATAMAINRMQARLRRFVDDRTNMLAAISHDLRTPITSLRLRAEFIADTEMRDKIISTLEELQSMVDATLTFTREASIAGETRVIDMNALVGSVCDDLAELGQRVTVAEATKAPMRCRPEALRRAVRNIVENAVRYGGCARVQVQQHREHLNIVVDDDGPGIPESEHERVFAPFVRLEESRSRDTGGVGLGLSIARTIVHAHGGEIRLQNREGGGLRLVIELPNSM